MKLPKSLRTVTIFSKIITVLVFFLLLLGSFYAGTLYKNTYTFKKDETSSWKTYTSPDNFFSFKYPPHLTYTLDVNAISDGPGLQGSKLTFKHEVTEEELSNYFPGRAPKTAEDFSLFYTSNNDINLRDFITGGIIEDDVKKIKINDNVSGEKIVWACQSICVDYIFREGNNIFNFSWGNVTEEELRMLDQVVSTFEFSN